MSDALDDLDNVLRWYTSAYTLLTDIKQALEQHPEHPLFLQWTEEGQLTDEALKYLDKTLRRTLEVLGDYTVVALFSAFEAWIEADYQKRTGRSARIGEILEFYKKHNLIPAPIWEAMVGVKEFRDWVAHGRRWASPVAVDPRDAHNFLGQFIVSVEGKP